METIDELKERIGYALDYIDVVIRYNPEMDLEVALLTIKEILEDKLNDRCEEN